MKKGMRKVLEEVVIDVLRRLPPDVPDFNKVAGFGFAPKIHKSKRKMR